MLRTTDQILASDLADHVIHDQHLAHLFGGSDARRYGLVNKALKAKELTRLRRGLYVVTPPYHPTLFSQYYLANHLVPYSFVTAESALSFHQWIPERVTEVTSVSAAGRNKHFDTSYGRFVYRVLPIVPASFWLGVRRIEASPQGFWMAKPLRALLDYIEWRKLNQVNLDFLEHSLRIDIEQLQSLQPADFTEVASVYASTRSQQFLTTLQRELNHVASDH